MGKLIDKIREILFGKKMKMLPAGEDTVDHKNSMNDFKQEISNYEQVLQVNNPYIEYALTEYFNEYLKQINDSVVTGIVPNSYTVLTGINAVKEDTNKNAYYERNLLSKMKQESKYNVNEQNDPNTGTCAFYHVQSMNYRLPDDKDLFRIYLNCRDENVANLAEQLLDNNTNPNFYLKFDSTDAMNRRARSEKIVIYTDKEHWNQDTQNIMNVKTMNPQLFIDSEKMNPFIEQYANTFSAIRQTNGGNYTDLNGVQKKITNSANIFISQILQDSYTETVQHIAEKDPNLRFLLDDSNLNNFNLYIQNYPYINSIYHEELINRMEKNMTTLSLQNNVFINGISNSTQEQNRNDSHGEYPDDENSL